MRELYRPSDRKISAGRRDREEGERERGGRGPNHAGTGASKKMGEEVGGSRGGRQRQGREFTLRGSLSICRPASRLSPSLGNDGPPLSQVFYTRSSTPVLSCFKPREMQHQHQQLPSSTLGAPHSDAPRRSLPPPPTLATLPPTLRLGLGCPVLDGLLKGGLAVDDLSPRQALELLYRWKSAL